MTHAFPSPFTQLATNESPHADQPARTTNAKAHETARGRFVRRVAAAWPLAIWICALLGVGWLGLGHAAACALQKAPSGHGPLLKSLSVTCDEDALLGPDRRPTLYAIADARGRYLAQRPVAVLVHGLAGHPADLAGVADQLSQAGYQVHALFFDDMGQRVRDNGRGLAAELLRLAGQPGQATGSLTVVAHSAGGLVARLALNLLAAAGQLQRFDQVHLYAIDTPWHGYFGPSDRTLLGRLRMRVVEPFMPNGMEDLRAESLLFTGDPDSANTALARGLLRYPLPPHVHVHLCFAQHGDQVHDYTEGLLQSLSEQIARYYREARPVRGSAQLQNFWHALISTDSYFGFQDELRQLADRGGLSAWQVERALLRHFPRFPGNHETILRPQVQMGQVTLLSQLVPTLHARQQKDARSRL